MPLIYNAKIEITTPAHVQSKKINDDMSFGAEEMVLS